MSKTVRAVVAVVLAVLTVVSGALFVIAVTRPGVAYDPHKVKLDVDLHTREQLLTCAYKIYGDDSQNFWVAKTLIKNVGKIPVYDFRISYKVGDFSDWTSGENYPEICPGQTVRDFCWANLDSTKVKEVTTKTPVELIVKYEYRGLDKAVEDYEKIYLLGKNDFVFTSLSEDQVITFADGLDNHSFVAAFITPNEETTKSFANRVAGGLETRTNEGDVYQAFIRCFNELRAHGVRYIQEPAGFWAGTDAQYIQYPRETLDRKSGTCLDLAIAMSALMQAVGIKTYVYLIPGHAIPAIALPESGNIVPVESTFIDREYALSHYPGVTSSDVTAEECVDLAVEELNNAKAQGQMLVIDPEYWWHNGVMPSW